MYVGRTVVARCVGGAHRPWLLHQRLLEQRRGGVRLLAGEEPDERVVVGVGDQAGAVEGVLQKERHVRLAAAHPHCERTAVGR